MGDLAVLAQKWLLNCSADDCGGANFDDSDNVVNFDDYALFSPRWSEKDPALLANYQFNESPGTSGGSTTADSAGSLDGTLVGNATIISDAGGNGKAASNVLQLDGDGDYVNLGTSSCIFTCDYATAEWTIASWLKTTNNIPIPFAISIHSILLSAIFLS